MSGRSACLLLLALSSHATALTMGLRPTRWSGRTAVVCREADATLLDPATGKTLKCLIAGTVVVEIPGAEDEVYGALYPADTPITLAQMEDDVLVPLMEADERALFSMAQRACKDMDIELLDTAVLLTAGSGLDELLMNADDMSDADDDEDDEDAEEAMVLTAFQHEVRPAAPCCPLLPLPLPPPCRGSLTPSPHVDAAAPQGDEVYVMKPLDPMVPHRALTLTLTLALAYSPSPGPSPRTGPNHVESCIHPRLLHGSSSSASARARAASCCRRTRRSMR